MPDEPLLVLRPVFVPLQYVVWGTLFSATASLVPGLLAFWLADAGGWAVGVPFALCMAALGVDTAVGCHSVYSVYRDRVESGGSLLVRPWSVPLGAVTAVWWSEGAFQRPHAAATVWLDVQGRPLGRTVTNVLRGREVYDLVRSLTPSGLGDGAAGGTFIEAPAANFRTKVLVRRGEDALVLRPTWGQRLPSLMFMLGGVLAFAVIGGYIKSPKSDTPHLGYASASATVLWGIGLLTLLTPRRFTFDRRSGLMRNEWFGLRWCRPLSEVRAVQVLRSPRRMKWGYLWQVNLVFDDAGGGRVCLECHNRGAAIRADAEELAAFLGAPLQRGASAR